MMQIPTPTPFPQVLPQDMLVSLPSGYSVWAFADDAVGWWNRAGADKTVILQWALILVLVFLATFFIVGLVRSLSRDRSGEE